MKKCIWILLLCLVLAGCAKTAPVETVQVTEPPTLVSTEPATEEPTQPVTEPPTEPPTEIPTEPPADEDIVPVTDYIPTDEEIEASLAKTPKV